MSNSFSRAIDHLTATDSEDEVLRAFQAVEDLFEKLWLTKKDTHRLQILWERKDYIASSELYSLGKSIMNLAKKESTWLQSTAKEIKKNKDTSHGLITEIIIIGSMCSNTGIVTPCNKSFPIYDYTVDFDNGFSSKVSIKNFDISVHERDFNLKCELIKKTFTNFLEFYKTTGSLVVFCEGVNLSQKVLIEICSFIVSGIKEYGTYDLVNNCRILYTKLHGYEDHMLRSPSGTVLVVGSQHKNEQRNIESKILDANKSMLRDTNNDYSLKKLIIRLGETTDPVRIKSFLQDIADDYINCGFDMCIVMQPTVVTDQDKGTTSINTLIIPITRSFAPTEEKLVEKARSLGKVKISIGTGTIATKKAPVKLITSTGEYELNNCYIYQKGDIYSKFKLENGVYSQNLMQSAPGIKFYPVVDDITLEPIIFPDHNKLLIV